MEDKNQEQQQAAAAAAEAAEEKKTGEAQANANEGEGGEKTGEAAATEKTPKELVYERIRTLRPEGKYDEDEMEYSRKAMEIIDELEKKGLDSDKMLKQLAERFAQDPEDAQVYLDYLGGMKLRDAYVKNLGEEALAPPAEGDEGYDAFNSAREERKANLERNQKFAEELAANAAKSEETFTEFAKKNGFSDEEAQGFKDFVMAEYENFLRGIITEEALERYLQMRNYKNDVDGAYKQGEIDGQNKKIEAQKKKMEGSGLPDGRVNSGTQNDKPLDPREEKARRMAEIRLG